MAHTFDKNYWESHWQKAARDAGGQQSPASPYLAAELAGLDPGTALDGGCGAGADAIWLAQAGWKVTAVDISDAALARAAERAERDGGVDDRIRWVAADLSVWEPGRQFDLVTTHYAHPAMPQLEFYERIADWVAPGGTLLIVGHLHSSRHPDGDENHGDHRPPDEASATAEAVVAILDRASWQIVTADEVSRTLGDGTGHAADLDDVIVRATRLA